MPPLTGDRGAWRDFGTDGRSRHPQRGALQVIHTAEASHASIRTRAINRRKIRPESHSRVDSNNFALPQTADLDGNPACRLRVPS
jgi:hypothetical protein